MHEVPGPPPRRPSRVWYWVAGGLALVGILAAVAWGVLSVLRVVHRIDGFQRVAVPGSATVSFVRPGDFTLYLEGSRDDGFVPPTVTIMPVDGESVVPLRRYGGSLTYGFGHHGKALATFRIDRAGAYRLTTRTLSDTPVGVAEVAVGPGLGRLIAVGVVGAVALGLGGVAAGAVMAAVTAVRRYQASPARTPRAPAGGQPPSPAPAAGWYPDPANASLRRWWDGRAWTGHLWPPS